MSGLNAARNCQAARVPAAAQTNDQDLVSSPLMPRGSGEGRCQPCKGSLPSFTVALTDGEAVAARGRADGDGIGAILSVLSSRMPGGRPLDDDQIERVVATMRHLQIGAGVSCDGLFSALAQHISAHPGLSERTVAAVLGCLQEGRLNWYGLNLGGALEPHITRGGFSKEFKGRSLQYLQDLRLKYMGSASRFVLLPTAAADVETLGGEMRPADYRNASGVPPGRGDERRGEGSLPGAGDDRFDPECLLEWLRSVMPLTPLALADGFRSFLQPLESDAPAPVSDAFFAQLSAALREAAAGCADKSEIAEAIRKLLEGCDIFRGSSAGFDEWLKTLAALLSEVELTQWQICSALSGLRNAEPSAGASVLLQAIARKIHAGRHPDGAAPDDGFYGKALIGLQKLWHGPQASLLIQGLAEQIRMRGQLSSQGVCMALHGLQHMTESDGTVAWIDALLRHVGGVSAFAPAEVGNALWGLQRLSNSHPKIEDLFVLFASHIRRSGPFTELDVARALFGLRNRQMTPGVTMLLHALTEKIEACENDGGASQRGETLNEHPVKKRSRVC